MGAILSLIFRRSATKFSNLVQKKNPHGRAVTFSGLKSVLSEKAKLGIDSSVMVSVSKEGHFQKP